MASTTLYPPIVDNYTAAFIRTGSTAFCRLYYSLSRFSTSIEDIKSIHISITKQSSGENVINKNDNHDRFRTTGILILNNSPVPVEGKNNLYYIDILNEDIKNGWTVGWIYKIQIRFSTIAFPKNEISPSNWLNLNRNNFSEWSTYSVTKAIAKPKITIPLFDSYDSEQSGNSNDKKIYTLPLSTLEFSGAYSNQDQNEILYSYQIKLLDAEDSVLEDSDIIYANQYSPNQFYYNFKTELKNMENYKVVLFYETLNKFSEYKVFNINIVRVISEVLDFKILSAENEDIMSQYTSLEEEQDEGRVALKLYADNNNIFFGNVCICRSDSKTNFSKWEDIRILNIQGERINSLPLVYDYTIESGVWYKYGIQAIDSAGYRGQIKETIPIKREFAYSFLLGENNKQLKLKFNNTINNFKNNYNESKVDTIGSKFPFITRNGNTNYKVFSINGLISFNMDDKNLFTSKKEIYEFPTVVNLYNNKEKELYDYTYERDFRTHVLNFLQDGKPKLYKSPTEGNIIIRLMDINTTPEESLGRLIYNFSSNAYEIAEANMDNYLKYKFYSIGTLISDLSFKETRLGQIDMDILVNSNLFDLIVNKYSSNGMPIINNIYEVTNISNLSLTFTDKPLRIRQNEIDGADGDLVSGNNFSLNGNIITVNANYSRMYNFGGIKNFSPLEKLIILGDEDNQVQTVHVTANFLYDISIKPYKEKNILYKNISKNIGQINETFNPSDSIYNDIYYKYYYNWKEYFRQMSQLNILTIEANPGTVIALKDENDSVSDYHIIGPTGMLSFDMNYNIIKDFIYIGQIDNDGNINKTLSTDILVDYIVYFVEGKYEKEGII